MWPRTTVAGAGRWAGPVAAALAVVSLALAAAEPDRLAKAKAAIKRAAAEEKAAHTEWNSREMARSATREIAVSARATTERALQNVAAAAEELKAKCAAKAGGDAAAAKKRLAERIDTMRAAAQRMINEQRVANQATEDLTAIEQVLGKKMAATRAAERIALALEAEAARRKPDRAPAARITTEKASAAEQALREADAVSAWEAQGWLSVRRETLLQMAAGNAAAAEIATKLVTADSDANSRKLFQDFKAAMMARKGVQEKAAAELQQAIDVAGSQLEQLRAQAAGGLKPLAPGTWDYAKARHLLVRAGFGGTPDEVARLHAMGLYRTVDYLVDFQRRPAAGAAFEAAPPSPPDPLEGQLRNEFVRGRVAGKRGAIEAAQMQRLRLWWIKRLVDSPRPLQEKLTLFWHGHFATQYSVVRHSYDLHRQNELFREHAAGNFAALLYGIVHDPAMLRYLDNNTNVKGHANENLAREIMELFAMGVDQGYTERDIREAARALTGYTFDPASGQFRYIAALHDDGPKTIFGKTGNYTGDDLGGLILEQPATARFIARKLFTFFARSDPDAETIERLASVLRKNHYELAPTLQNLFLSEEFYSARTMGAQIKSPVQLVVGTLRDLGVKEVSNAGGLDAELRVMGQELFEPPDVKGWREGRSWINANRIFLRYNSVANLLKTVPQPNGRRGVDVVALLDGKCCTAGEVVDYLAKACLIRPLTPDKRTELLSYLGELPPPAQWAAQRAQLNERLQELLVLMTSMPEYQMT